MLPRHNAYGWWPVSCEIDLVESRGNSRLTLSKVNIGVQQVATTLHWYVSYLKLCNYVLGEVPTMYNQNVLIFPTFKGGLLRKTIGSVKLIGPAIRPLDITPIFTSINWNGRLVKILFEKRQHLKTLNSLTRLHET